jgi:hypothetical protein
MGLPGEHSSTGQNSRQCAPLIFNFGDEDLDEAIKCVVSCDWKTGGRPGGHKLLIHSSVGSFMFFDDFLIVFEDC